MPAEDAIEKEYPPDVTTAKQKLAWDKKEKARIEKEMQAEKIKQEKEAQKEKAKQEKEAQKEAAKIAREQAKAEKQESAKLKKERAQAEKETARLEAKAKKDAAKEEKNAAKAEAAKKKKEDRDAIRAEKEKEPGSIEVFKYRAKLMTTKSRLKVEIKYLEYQIVNKKRIMGSTVFDKIDSGDYSGAEETFVNAKKAVDYFKFILKPKAAELKQLEEEGQSENVLKPISLAELKANQENTK